MARKSFVLVCDNVNCQNETNSTISKEGNICPNCFKGTMRKKENDDEIKYTYTNYNYCSNQNYNNEFSIRTFNLNFSII